MKRSLRSLPPSARRVWFHKASAMIWLALLVPALLYWPNSVAFVIAASIYANVKADWGAAEAADQRELIEQLKMLEKQLTWMTAELQGLHRAAKDG